MLILHLVLPLASWTAVHARTLEVHNRIVNKKGDAYTDQSHPIEIMIFAEVNGYTVLND